MYVLWRIYKGRTMKSTSMRQTSLYDVTREVAIKGGKKGPIIAAECLFGVRKILPEYMHSRYARGGIVEIQDNAGPGFLIKRREGFVLKDSVVGGVRKVTKAFTTREGDERIEKLYSNEMRRGGSMTSGTKRSTKRGDRLHRLLHHMVECDTYGAVEKSQSLTKSDSLLSSHEMGGVCDCVAANGGRKWKNEETKEMNNVIDFLRYTMNLEPLCSEMFLYSPDLEMATRIDLLCVDKHLQFSLVSLKTGVYGRPSVPGNVQPFKFKGPFEGVHDSVQRRHDIQLLVELMLLSVCTISR